MVRVYGNILQYTQTEFLISVAAAKGVAPDVGLKGEVWFKHRQVKHLPQEDGFDVFECLFTLAQLKAQMQSGAAPRASTPKPKRGRKGKGTE